MAPVRLDERGDCNATSGSVSTRERMKKNFPPLKCNFYANPFQRGETKMHVSFPKIRKSEAFNHLQVGGITCSAGFAWAIYIQG